MHKRASFLLVLHSTAAVVLFPTAAVAQGAREVNDRDAPPAQAVPSVDASAQQGGIADIVVTAQRRTESVQKTSLAISVVSAKDLVDRGVSKASDLQFVEPSISVAQAGVFTQTNVRGAGDAPLNGLRQSAVTYYLDGVAFGQPVGISQNFYDLARVEVLKGPQGTLYGRNATGGAINLLTQRPTQEFGGYVTAELGNYDNKKLTGAINIPLSSTLAARGSFDIVDRNGYFSDGTGDDKRQSGRLQLYYEPSSAFNFRLYGSYSHVGGKGDGLTLATRLPGTTPWTSVSDPIFNSAVLGYTGGLSADFTPNSTQNVRQWQISGEANLRLADVATLTVIPAYRRTEVRQVSNAFSFPYNLSQNDDQTSVEARLGNQSDKLKWTVGTYYFDSAARFKILTFPLNPFAASIISGFNTDADGETVNRSLAAFGEATYGITDRLRVIGGLRYTRDRVTISGFYGDQNGPAVPQVGKTTFNAVTWKVGAEYDVGPASMAYVSASKGYKSGGFFSVLDTSGDNNYGPERLTALDFGIRNRFFDNQLQVNLEGFYWWYKDQQLSFVGFTSGGSISYLTRNAGSSQPYGGEANVVWKPTRNDTLTTSLSYNRARFSSFNVGFPVALASSLRVGSLCSVPSTPTPGVGGFPVLAVNCVGAPLPRTPQWTGATSYEHVFRLGAAGDVAANVSVTWATSRYLNVDYYVQEEKAGAYGLLNAQLTYTPQVGRWSVTAFARNLTKKAVYQGAVQSPLNGFIPGTPNIVLRQVGEPRVYGARATFNF